MTISDWTPPHPCTEPGCPHTVQFDDEPKCFKHSPDEGSSVPGYSWKAQAARTLADVVKAVAGPPPVDECPNIFMDGRPVIQVQTPDGWLNVHAGTQHPYDVVTLSMPSTLEIDVDLTSGTVIASRCWTPNVGHGQLGGEIIDAFDKPAGTVTHEIRRAEAVAIADEATWPDPTLHA